MPDVVNSYTSYAGLLGNVFSPITGVLMADYLVMKRARIDLEALFQRDGIYWYWHGFNPVAILWTLLGFAIYLYLPVAVMKTISTVLICGAGYCVTTWLVATYWKTLAKASRPGEQHGTVEDLAWQLAER